LASAALDEGRLRSEEIIRIALAFLAFKFDAVEDMLSDVLVRK